MRYFWLTVKHKWFVLQAGVRWGVPFWRLLLHDLSKFSRHELPHYDRQFFGAADAPLAFAKAWLHHQNYNEHHWEYWIPRSGHNRGTVKYPDNEPLPMPDVCVREMLADWYGASRAYEGRWPEPGAWPWLDKNFEKIRVHPDTRFFLAALLFHAGHEVRERAGRSGDAAADGPAQAVQRERATN